MRKLIFVLIAIGILATLVLNPKILSINKSQITVDPTTPPTVQSKPSERALKVAASVFVRTEKTALKKIKQTYGDENMSNTELIKLFAIKMDENPALLAQNEAEMQRIMAKEGQSVQTNYYEQPVTSYSESTGTTWDKFKQEQQQRKLEQQQECQQKMAEYNACLSEYNIKLGEYNNCLTGNNKYSYCSKPSNYCSKPYCF